MKATAGGGCAPRVIVGKRGAPVELDFFCDETDSCTGQVVFGDFGISRTLPAFRATRIGFTQRFGGAFTLNRGVNMARGNLSVEG